MKEIRKIRSELKMSNEICNMLEQDFIQLYKDTLKLEFDQTPDYDKFYALVTQYSMYPSSQI